MVCFGDPDHDRVLKTKPGHALKWLGPLDLVTPVPGCENRVFHLVLGPGHRSLMTRGKKVPILNSYFMKTHACVC